MSSSGKADRIPSGLDIITAVSNIIQTSRGLSSILYDMVDLVIEIVGSDDCAIWLYEDEFLRLKARHRQNVESAEEITLMLGEGITGMVAESREPMFVRDVGRDERYKPIPAMMDQGFKSILSVPILDGEKLVGVLNVQTLGEHDFTDAEQKFLLFIASQLVGAIRNTQLYEEVIKGFRKIAIIHQVGQIVSRVRDIDELLSIIARTCAEHLSTRGCVLRLLNRDTHMLEVKGYYGIPNISRENGTVGVGEGIAGCCVAREAPVVCGNIHDNPEGFVDSLGLNMTSVICVPLVVKGDVIGTLAIFDKMSMMSDELIPFDDEDVGLASVIGNQVAMAIDNARLYADKDEAIRELSLLLEISNIMRGTMDLEDLLYIILTGVTMEKGLGFNRALLFLAEKDESALIGKMAVGPMRPEEASRHWTAINPEGKSLQALIVEYGQLNRNAGFDMDRMVEGVYIPCKTEKGVLSQTVIERRSFNVKDYVPPEGSEEKILSDLGFRAFATVPLTAKGRVVGVMAVDNMVNRNPITSNDVELLQLFADHAATALEMNRIYKNLEKTNKRLVDARDMLVRTKTLATLGEFSAGIAHELRNPLVAIGGFARRLARKLEGNSKEARYARVISNEVEGMESILSQILEFVGGAKPVPRRIDVFHLLEQVFVLFTDSLKSSKIKIETEYDEEARYLYVDEVQMRQLFINLIKNAIEAMKEEGGTIRVKSAVMRAAEGGVGFEVEDGGVGISPEDLEHVFDPFFTRKATGTGLGLPMCSRIVENNHGGRIFVDSKVGRGTSVLIWFPPGVLTGESASENGTVLPDDVDAEELFSD
ncbi:MAG TPA: GAF domain-containing protein [bacterium]|nr:GAF domain-containing protein [bacterium]